MADREIWTTLHPITASTFLRDLREECLAHSELRMPKLEISDRTGPHRTGAAKGRLLPDELHSWPPALEISFCLCFQGEGLQVAAREVSSLYVCQGAGQPVHDVVPSGFPHVRLRRRCVATQIHFGGDVVPRLLKRRSEALGERVLATFSGYFFSART